MRKAKKWRGLGKMDKFLQGQSTRSSRKKSAQNETMSPEGKIHLMMTMTVVWKKNLFLAEKKDGTLSWNFF